MRDTTAFGQRVQQRRTALGLTQKVIALRAACSLSLIRKIEAGVRPATRQVAERLADALEIDAQQRETFINLAVFGSADEPRLTIPSSPPRSPSGWLPAPPAPIVGREADIAAVGRALLHSSGRMLTLLGPPGVGKTRLGIEAAATLRREFSDGVWFVALAPLSDAALVGVALARTLGVREPTTGALLPPLINHLRECHALLVLDNCEHVLVAARTLAADLLQACPHLYVLATSREPLRVRAEHRFFVRPLGLPKHTTPEVIASAPATALFVERAEAVAPMFVLDGTNAATVAAICARLDGLPLAIELAAARCDILSLDVLLTQLDRRLDALTDGPHDLPDHQRTLHDAIVWSYDLLNTKDQRSFVRLGVFAGGCTPEAAHAVGASHLDRLRAKSLLQQGADGTSRYMLLETLREFALTELERRADAEATRARHAAYFAQLAAHVAPHLRAAERTSWLRQLDVESDNVRAAMRWSLEYDGGATAARIASALFDYWRARGLFGEGGRWLDAALSADEEQKATHPEPQNRRTAKPTHPLTQHERARAYYVAAFLHSQRGDLRAQTYFAQSLAISQEIGDQPGVACVLNRLGMMARYPGNHGRALALLHESLAIQRAHGGDEIGNTLNQIGLALLERSDYAEAERFLHEMITYERSQGAVRRVMGGQNNIAEARWRQGDFARGRQLYEEVVVFARRTDDREVLAEALDGLGDIAIRTGDLAQAAMCYEESLAIYREMGLKFGIMALLHHVVYLALARDDYAQAAVYADECLPLACDSFGVEAVADLLTAQALISSAHGEAQRATQLLGASTAFSECFALRADTLNTQFAQRATTTVCAQLGDNTFERIFESAHANIHARIPNVRFDSVYDAARVIHLREIVATVDG